MICSRTVKAQFVNHNNRKENIMEAITTAVDFTTILAGLGTVAASVIGVVLFQKGFVKAKVFLNKA